MTRSLKDWQKRVESLEKEERETLIHMVSVTDEIVKEQDGEQLIKIQSQLASARQMVKYKKAIKSFRKAKDTVHAIEITNEIDLLTELNKKRMRPPDITDRRSLKLLSDEFNHWIIIKNPIGQTLDEIGQTEYNSSLVIYVASKDIDDYEQGKGIIPIYQANQIEQPN